MHRGRSFSLSLWSRAAAPWDNPWAEVIAKGPEENAWRIGRSGQSSGLTLSLGASSRGDRTIDVRAKFHHCALVFDHETHIARYYVNGVEQMRDICSIAENSSRVWIGGGPWPNSVGHWHGTIDDVAVWKRALSAREVARFWNAGAGMELWQFLPDADTDGQYDSWEEERGLNTQLDDAALDLDGDGLSNLEEAELNTDPRLADTDGDGLSDSVESRTGIRVGNGDTGTDPVSPDTDEDGLIDSDPLEPDPLDPDFDKDGVGTRRR
ncbi:MAG: LamG-like jellyroll fold domain-containing protein [Verrucomicrobiales bacterium]